MEPSFPTTERNSGSQKCPSDMITANSFELGTTKCKKCHWNVFSKNFAMTGR